MIIYLDHNATTPVRPEVASAMAPYLAEVSGNPSSLHRFGLEAREAVEGARARLASLLGAGAGDLHFTGGGTEADNWALKGVVAAARRARPRQALRLVTTSIEHAAVLHPARYLADLGVDVAEAPASERGIVDVEALLAQVDERTILVSVMHANNETGVLQPVREIAAALRQRGVPLHVDAVQSFGKVPVRVEDLGADLVSLSAHKLYGPKGVGALYVRPGTALEPLIHGGGHEAGLRAGTENVAGIVGFAAAAALSVDEMAGLVERLTVLRDRLEAGIRERTEGAVPHGAWAPRLPNTLSVAFPGVDAEALVTALDLEGIAVSSGSACSAGRAGPSHVLLAMGVPPHVAASSLRFSLGRDNTADQVDAVLDCLPGQVARLRAVSGYRLS